MTAVQFYAIENGKLEVARAKGLLTFQEMFDKMLEILNEAKEMEKQQIGKAFLNGRLKEIGSGVLFDLQPLTETFHNYYNETFKSE
jgi:hypothetical protein